MFICKVVQAYQNLQGVFWHRGSLYTLATYLCGRIVPIKVCRAVELVSLVQTDLFFGIDSQKINLEGRDGWQY